MKKIGFFVLATTLLMTQLRAQYGSVGVFEKNAEQEVISVRIFPVKCTVTKMDDSAYLNLRKSINAFMHLDGSRVYTQFYIPFTGYDGAREFAIDEYIGKKAAKKVKFIREFEEILLDNGGNVVSTQVKERPAGIMVIYYADFSKTADATVINSAYAYTVYSKTPINAQEVAKTLAGRVVGSSKYTYEWLPGKTMEYAKNKIGPGITFRDNGEFRIN